MQGCARTQPVIRLPATLDLRPQSEDHTHDGRYIPPTGLNGTWYMKPIRRIFDSTSEAKQTRSVQGCSDGGRMEGGREGGRAGLPGSKGGGVLRGYKSPGALSTPSFISHVGRLQSGRVAANNV